MRRLFSWEGIRSLFTQPGEPPVTRRAVIRGSAAGAVVGWVGYAVFLFVAKANPMWRADTAVQERVADIAHPAARHAPWLRGLSYFLAHLGAAEVMVPVLIAIALLFFLWRWTLLPTFMLGAAYTIVVVTVTVTKPRVHRPEPYDLPGELGRAFPSGHTASAVMVWSGFALCFWLWATPEARRYLRWVIAAAASVIGVVHVAMLGRSAHWWSDLIGGDFVGLACLSTLVFAFACVGLVGTLERPCASPRDE